MTNKTPESKLKANAKYNDKSIQKPVRFKIVEDADLIAAISRDNEALNKLINRLLRAHYDIKK